MDNYLWMVYSTTFFPHCFQAKELLQLPVWSPIIEDVLIAYSTHWDIRELHSLEPPYVRVLTTMLNTSYAKELVGKRYGCLFYYGNGSTITVLGQLIPHEPSDHSSSAFFLLCPARQLFGGDYSDPPMSVSVQCDRCLGAWTYDVSLSFRPLRFIYVYCLTFTYIFSLRRFTEKKT